MPQINEIMPGGEMDTSESLQVSSTSPGQTPTNTCITRPKEYQKKSRRVIQKQ